MKVKKILIFLLILMILSTALVGCDTSFTINFDSNGGSAVQSVVIDSSTTKIELPTSTREGYIFKGWYWDNTTFINEMTGNLDISKLEGVTTLFAKWEKIPEINEYTVRFADDDGNVIKTETVKEGSSATAPNDPIKKGYTFSGWDKEFSKVASDLDIKAMFTINMYTLSFNSLGSIVETKELSYDDLLVSHEVANDELTFAGWYYDSAFEKSVDFETAKISDADLTVFAKWTLEGFDPTITSNKEGNSFQYGEDITLDVDGEVAGLSYSYQWKFNGKVISNERILNLTRANSDEYEYTVVVEVTKGSTNFTYTTQRSINIIVTKAQATITAEDKSVVYGEENPEFTFTMTGLVEGDTTAVVSGLTLSTARSAFSNVGDYSITASGSATNYELTFTDGELTVSKAQATITAEDKSVVYGEENPKFTFTMTGLVGEDTTAVVSGLTLSTVRTTFSNVGDYSITASGSATNYELTFIAGILTVSKAQATFEAHSKEVTFADEVPELTYTVSGLLGNDTKEDFSISTTYAKGSSVGEYDITLTGTSNNYDIEFINSKLTVSKYVVKITNKELYEFNSTAWSNDVWNLTLPEGYTFSGTLATSGSAIKTYTCKSDVLNDDFIWSKSFSITKENIDVASNFDITYDLSIEIAVGVIKHSATETIATYDKKPHNITVTVEDETIQATTEYSLDNETWSTDIKLVGAGSYTVYYRISANNYTTAKGSSTVTISKASVAKPTYTSSNFVYDNTEKTANITTNSLYTISGNKQTNAGEYTATVVLKDKSNYQWTDETVADLTFEWTIAKQSVEMPSLSATEFTYNASEQLVTITVNDLYTISGDKQTNAGEYTATVALNDKLNYQWTDETVADLTFSWTIARQSVDVPTHTSSNFVYDNTEKTANITTSDLYTISGNKQTNAGEYTATVVLKDKSNYQWTDETVVALTFSWSIARQGVEKPSLSATEFTYNTAEQSVTITENGLYTSTGIFGAVNAGTYEVVVKFVDSANYQWADGTFADLTFEWTIERQSVDVPTHTSSNFVYDNTEKTADITTNSLYTISGDKQTNAGEYTATVALNDSANYQWADGTFADLTFEWTIARQSVDVPTHTSSNFVYDNTEKTANITTSDLYTISGNKQTNAGEYTATVVLKDKSNYQWTDETVVDLTFSWSIARQGVEKPSLSATEFTYNASEQSVTITVNGLYTSTGIFGAVNAGTYEVVVKFVDSANYQWADGTFADLTFEWTIARQSVEKPSLSATEFTYNASEQLVTITENDLYTSTGTFGAVNAGTYEVVVKFVDSENYQWADGTFADLTLRWTIEKAQLTYTISNDSVVFGTASPVFVSSYKNGLLGNDTEEVVSNFVYTTTRELFSAEGEYDITATATADNYEIVFEKGILAVTEGVLDAKEEPIVVSVNFTNNAKANYTFDELKLKSFATINGVSYEGVSLSVYSDAYHNVKVEALELSRAGSTYVLYGRYEGEQVSNFIDVTFIIKVASVTIGKTENYLTIEDALRQSENGALIIVKYNTSFAPTDIATIASYTTDNGSYTVKGGVTLLVPYDNKYSSGLVDSGAQANSVAVNRTSYFVHLIIEENLTLNVEGTLTVNSKKGFKQPYSGSVEGANYGLLITKAGSVINTSGTINANGYIIGEGEIIATSGTVVDSVLIYDYKGGTTTTNIYNNMFPINSYAFVGIEIKTTINFGAKLSGRATLYVRGWYDAILEFVGSDEKSFIQLKSGYFVKTYNKESGRITMAIYAEAGLNNFELKIGPVSATTINKHMPINGNISLIIAKGSVVTSDVNLKFLPGSTMTVEEGAEIVSKGDIYVYGKGETPKGGDYPYFAQSYLSYTYTAFTADWSEANNDAIFVVNGTLRVNNGIGGKIRTTGASARIIMNPSAVMRSTVKEDNKPNGLIEVTSKFNLDKNGDQVFTEVTSINNYVAFNGIWYSFNFDSNSGTDVDFPSAEGYGTDGENVTFNFESAPVPTKDNWTFAGWYTDDTFTTKLEGVCEITNNMTVVAKWTIDVTFVFDETKSQVITQTYGKRYIVPTETPVNFHKWFNNEAKLGIADDSLATENTNIFHATFKNPITVTLNANGGVNSNGDAIVILGLDKVNPDTNNIPTFGNNIFLGWYIDESFASAYDKDFWIEEDITLYARWAMRVSVYFANEQLTGDFKLVADEVYSFEASFVNLAGAGEVSQDFINKLLDFGISNIHISGYTSIPANAFKDRTINKLFLSNSITSIGVGAFNNCTINSLYTDVGAIAEMTGLYMVGADGKPVGAYAEAVGIMVRNQVDYTLCFVKRTATKFVIPSETTIISAYALQGTEITETLVPDGVKEIGAFAFANTKISETIKIGKAVAIIGERAFAGTGITKFDCTAVGKERPEKWSLDWYSGTTEKATVEWEAQGCVTGDTLITMADGSQKPIEQINLGDYILVWNFFTGKQDVAEVILHARHGVRESNVLRIFFDDGTSVSVVDQHGFFDVELNAFVTFDIDSIEQYLGKSFYKYVEDDNGQLVYTTSRLVSYTYNIEVLASYDIVTNQTLNYYVNGMLSSQAFTNYVNILEYKGMEYDQEQMEADLIEYGLFTYEDFKDVCTNDQFVWFGAKYYKKLVVLGYISMEEIAFIMENYISVYSKK